MIDPSTFQIPGHRDALVVAAMALIGRPYFFGGDFEDDTPGKGGDCNGVILRAGKAAGVYPDGPRLSAHEIWEKFVPVDWPHRRPGDVVCFGTPSTGCHHVVLVADHMSVIGANHGTPPLDYGTPQQESVEDYVKRMAAQDGGKGARVCLAPDYYWASQRLGVVRFPLIHQALLAQGPQAEEPPEAGSDEA